ncbi:hypothetical protein PGTUg99_024317 [Puccinia graminis f. sp. tritici]|uniref:Uncharacterized protein n=1 Tax=Puccinia graminis f. sp. tritici TaxID=56615 RepID=A0A5B0S6R5_PUCGR|nr:hypothetical protein PGTUg99_024317 [Puccinia graminis f. sp. tritici]
MRGSAILDIHDHTRRFIPKNRDVSSPYKHLKVFTDQGSSANIWDLLKKNHQNIVNGPNEWFDFKNMVQLLRNCPVLKYFTIFQLQGPKTHKEAVQILNTQGKAAWRALGDFLHFSAPQHVLLRFVVRGNLLDGLVVPPLLFPSSSNSTLPSYPTLKFPPASHDVLRCHSLGLRLSPLRRLSVQVLLRPLLDRSPTAASASGSLRTPLPPLVGREPRCPPVPGFPAASFSEPCAFGLLFPAFPRLGKLDFLLMRRHFPQLACAASAPHAFRISREHSAVDCHHSQKGVLTPHAPEQTGQSFGQGALSPPHRVNI